MPDIDLDDDETVDEIVVRRRSGLPAAAIDWTGHAGDADGMVGAELIQTFVKRLPNSPGVYRMFNAAGDVLYVGKARSLKKRVSNYAQGRVHSNRIGKMVRETANDGVRRRRAPRSRRCCSKPI
jgi:excinuclease ABC subunit C